MSNFIVKIRVFILASLVPFLGAATVFGTVPSQINYQGRLEDGNGIAIDGTQSIRFSIYNDENNGDILWNEEHSVLVTNGVFNVKLGSITAFTGAEFENSSLYLEVAILNGINWEPLTPRQKIMSTAYAMKAGNADTVEGASLAELDGRYINVGQLDGITSVMIQSGAVTSDDIQDNSLTATDLATNSVGALELAAGSVGSEEVIDNSLTAEDLASESVGSDEIALGSVGHNDMADGAALTEIADDDGPGSGLNADYLDDFSSSHFMTADTDNWVDVTGDAMSGQLSISKAGQAIYIDSDPVADIHYGLYMDVDHGTSNNHAYGTYSSVDSTASSANVYGNYTTASKFMGSGDTTGNVFGNYVAVNHRGTGGTTYGGLNYAYGSDVGNVYGSYAYASKESTDTAGTSYGGYFHGDSDFSADGYGVYGYSTGAAGKNYGIYGKAVNGSENYGGYFETTNDYGIPVVGLQSYSYTLSDLAGYFEPGGFFGGRNGVIAFTEDEYGNGLVAKATGNSTKAIYAIASGDNAYGFQAYVYSNGTGEDQPRGVEAVALGPGGYGGYFHASGTDSVGVFASGTLYAADFDGNVRIREGATTIIELGKGLDYAEGFDISDNDRHDPGSVLIIDPQSPGKLKLSGSAYDTKVAGIVAGANGLGSGIRLGGDQFDNDVALAGRVYCKVDATHAEIQTGDLLTTSEVPGYAMKAVDYSKAHGAILGKAMEVMPKGDKGKILVLVTLQ